MALGPRVGLVTLLAVILQFRLSETQRPYYESKSAGTIAERGGLVKAFLVFEFFLVLSAEYVQTGSAARDP